MHIICIHCFDTKKSKISGSSFARVPKVPSKNRMFIWNRNLDFARIAYVSGL